MAKTLRVVIPPHPLIAHWLTILRSQTTPPALYAAALEELGRWLTYEALRDWAPIKEEKIKTSNGETNGQVIDSNISLLAFPLSAGGYELWFGGRKVLPNAHLCLNGIPEIIGKDEGIIIYIDQISCGENLLKVLEKLRLKEFNFKRVRVITALTASPGLKLVGENIPDLTIYSACIDSEIKDKNEINPGIGDPDVRLNKRTNLQ